MVEKGKQPGSHLLSGAVVNPRSLQPLFGGRLPHRRQFPSYGPVPGEAVYVLTRRRRCGSRRRRRCATAATSIVSLSHLGRWLAEQAEELGATILPETAGETLLVADGRVVGVRTGDKGRGPDGEQLANFEPGTDIVAQVTVLAEGTQGHLTGVALDHFGLRAERPQTWELGRQGGLEGREAPRPGHPHHGLAAAPAAKYREFGGSFIYPMGPDLL